MGTFYDEVVETTAKSSPWTYGDNSVSGKKISDEFTDQKTTPLTFYTHNNGRKLKTPRSIMNEHVGINYRTIYNGYIEPGNDVNFTPYDDYVRCMNASNNWNNFLKDKRNPTYANIMKWYNNDSIDPHGLARYKMQDFIYLKYYNQIPNNHMITLRRYAQPVPDHVFGLDMNYQMHNYLNNFSDDFYALATAVTYMGEQTGNKLSDILKFDYGAKWETKTAQVNQLQSSDGGLAGQLGHWGVSANNLAGTGGINDNTVKSTIITSIVANMRGMSVAQMQAYQHSYPQNAYLAQYGEEFYGDINTITETSMRARGLTFSNNFTLNFEYSLKSLKCVNPRVAMMDILSNFLILTGNYGSFWGGETIYYGARNIVPQFGNPQLLRQGKYGEYLNSLANSMRKGFETFKNANTYNNGNFSITSALGNLLKGGLQALLGNLLGGNIGVAGEAQAPPALLSGEPTGFWHLTIGNPLDPIAMMGNMKIEKTTVQFNDALGYDDFPTEIKFTVEMSHGKPRDNGGIENMFNGTKGRFYVLSRNFEEKVSSHKKNQHTGFQTATTTGEQSAFSSGDNGKSGDFTNGKLKIIGGLLG